MSLSRRQFIKASGVALCAGAAPLKAHAAGQQPALPVPPLLESRRGQPLFLTLQRSHWSFTPGTRAPVWDQWPLYGADDPRLERRRRQAYLQQPPDGERGDDHPRSAGAWPADWRRGAHDVAERRLGAGAAYPPERGDAVVSGQHAEPDGETGLQRSGGHVAGGRRGQQEPADPNHYGVDDFPVIIQDKRLDNFGTPEYSEPGSGGFVGDTLLVNGVQSPYVEVSRGWVRLRLLNASNSRRYQLQMSDGRLLHVISGDQGFLPAPVSLKQLSLAPGSGVKFWSI